MTTEFVIAGPDPQSRVRVALLEKKAWIPDQVRDDNRRSGMTTEFVIAGPDPQSRVRVVLLEEKAWIPDQVRDDNRWSGMTTAGPG